MNNEISKIQLDSGVYDIKDAQARSDIATINNSIDSINGSIGDINTAIEGINGDITNINGEITNLNSFFNYDIIVDINGTGDYNSLASAVANASNGDTIFVRRGTYNNEVVDCLGKNLTIIGEDKDTTIIQNELDSRLTSPLTIARGIVKNLSFKSVGIVSAKTDKSYACHIDDNESVGNSLLFENCYFSSLTNSAVGIGLRPNFSLIFNNCEFYSEYSTLPNNNNRGTFFIHNSADSSNYGSNQNCYIFNSKIHSKYKACIHLESCGPVTNVGYLHINNTNIFSDEYGNGNATNTLLTRDIYVTATDYNMLLADDSSGNGNPIINYSKYATGSGNEIVIDKFINNQTSYPIIRKVYSYAITADTELHLTLPDDFGDLIDLKGSVYDNNACFPLGYDDGSTIVTAFIDKGANRINVNSTTSGTALIFLECWVNKSNT